MTKRSLILPIVLTAALALANITPAFAQSAGGMQADTATAPQLPLRLVENFSITQPPTYWAK